MDQSNTSMIVPPKVLSTEIIISLNISRCAYNIHEPLLILLNSSSLMVSLCHKHKRTHIFGYCWNSRMISMQYDMFLILLHSSTQITSPFLQHMSKRYFKTLLLRLWWGEYQHDKYKHVFSLCWYCTVQSQTTQTRANNNWRMLMYTNVSLWTMIHVSISTFGNYIHPNTHRWKQTSRQTCNQVVK